MTTLTGKTALHSGVMATVVRHPRRSLLADHHRRLARSDRGAAS